MDKYKILRYSILILFLAFFSFFAFEHFLLGGGSAASVDALCPFGGFETLITFFMTGNLVPRIMISSMILALGVILTVIIFRRGFCGVICPFGTINELLGKITKKKITIPKNVDSKLRWIKYIVLIAILIGTAITGTLVFREYDPFVTFFHFGKGLFWDYNAEEAALYAISGSILVIVLLAAIFIERAWCKYLCPLGAITAMFSKIGFTKISRNKKTCIDCKICDKNCPMNVDVSTVDEVKSAECIDCGICVNSCPKKSLDIKTFGKTISKYVYIIGVVLLLMLVIGVSKAFDVWQSVPQITQVSDISKVNPEDIKGWMTLSNVSQMTGIPLVTLITGLDLPPNVDVNIQMKSIATTYGITFDTEAVRDFVLNYKPTQTVVKETCPYGLHNESYPGTCGLYKDVDGNKICDLSE